MTVVLLAAVPLTVAGCGAQPPAPVPTRAVPPSTAPAGPPGTDPASGDVPPSSAPPVTAEDPPPTAGDVPGALPYGRRRATGIIERSGTCTLLRVGASHWELTGPWADGLADGATVTVTGQVTTATGCTGNAVRTLIVDPP